MRRIKSLMAHRSIIFFKEYDNILKKVLYAPFVMKNRGAIKQWKFGRVINTFFRKNPDTDKQ
ncbi:hypothetical protein CUJ83_05875 [Methanocella sp. CWC-04]|uniref:Uncharacterized protein n=1 Tax=Methanooceanicella nereidis TaxID=2052831 RepID=A0AAP2RBP8_9EURY|nr:hypothetical protein [Methanocella sp. CWC-04]